MVSATAVAASPTPRPLSSTEWGRDLITTIRRSNELNSTQHAFQLALIGVVEDRCGVGELFSPCSEGLAEYQEWEQAAKAWEEFTDAELFRLERDAPTLEAAIAVGDVRRASLDLGRYNIWLVYPSPFAGEALALRNEFRSGDPERMRIAGERLNEMVDEMVTSKDAADAALADILQTTAP